MQHCTFCGAYFAEKNPACSRCGRAQLPIAPYPSLPVETPGANASRKATLPAWLLATTIALLVIVGGAGAFALISHTPVSSPGKSAMHTLFGNNGTQNRTGSTSVTNTHAVITSKNTTTTLACPLGSSHTASFTFTGAIAGPISLSTFEACNAASSACAITCFSPSNSGSQTYFAKAQGKIDGITYQFEFLINPYEGPGAYTSTGSINVILMRNNYEWESYGATSNHASIIVKPGGKIGSIRATVSMMSPQFDPTNMVIVTGSWS